MSYNSMQVKFLELNLVSLEIHTVLIVPVLVQLHLNTMKVNGIKFVVLIEKLHKINILSKKCLGSTEQTVALVEVLTACSMAHSPLPCCFLSFQLHLTALFSCQGDGLIVVTWYRLCIELWSNNNWWSHKGGDCNPGPWFVSGVECGLLDIYRPSSDSW